MRIGIDIRNIGKKRTGDEVVFLNLVRELARFDSENEYFLFLDARTEADIREIGNRLGTTDKPNFTFVQLPAKNKFDWNLWYVPNFLRKHAVDIYHTQYILPFFVPRRTQLVTHIHDVSFRAYPQYIAPIDRFFLGALIPMSLRRARLIVVPSEFTRREVMKYYQVPEEKIVTVWNAVSREFFEEDSTRSDAVRAKYRLPKSFVLSVGTLQPRKNIPMLLEACARLRDIDPDIGVVLVGNREGHHVDRNIDRTITRLGMEQSVVFPGFVDQRDLPLLMSLARVFVFPSLYEGFGIPMLEAMSRGVPVIASDISSLREAGDSAAMFVPPGDTDSWVEALQKMCAFGNVREEFVKKGFLRARYFSWEKSARTLLAAYEKICFHERIAS